MQHNKQFDIIVFGASGFTGARICSYIARRAQPETRIAVAGRNQKHLEDLLSELKVSWNIITASYEVPSTISEMASRGRVIINCVGPYRHFGLALPEACIHAHTDYIDVCGEPEFLERTQLELHDLASAAGALVVGSCGFDSVPSDLGAWCTYHQLLKQGAKSVDSIECFMSLKYGKAGIAVHYPTYESAIYGMANVSKLKEVRRQLNQRHPSQQNSSTNRNTNIARSSGPRQRLFFDSRVQKWALPFPGADSSVLRRSFQNLAKDAGRRPDISVYSTVSSLLWALIVSIWGTLFMFLTGFPIARTILLQFPYLFSLGTVSHSGPTEQQIKETSFEVNIFGQGCTDSSGSINILKKSVRVSGPEPGYVATSIIAAECAFVLLSERQKLQFQGGVLTPALAFQGSNLIRNLHEAGIRFDVIE